MHMTTTYLHLLDFEITPTLCLIVMTLSSSPSNTDEMDVSETLHLLFSYNPPSKRFIKIRYDICSIAVGGLAIPPDQNLSHNLATSRFNRSTKHENLLSETV